MTALSAAGFALIPIGNWQLAGKAVAEQIRRELAVEVTEMQQTLSVTPGLAVVLVGDRTDSATYVRMKKKACEEVGVASFGFDYPADVTQEELLNKIDELNADPNVHGILVQLPLPAHIHEDTVLQRISVDKDVDGLHPLNVAKLANTKYVLLPSEAMQNVQIIGNGERRGVGDPWICCVMKLT